MADEVTNTQLAVAIARLETKLDAALDTIKINSGRIKDIEEFQTEARATLKVFKFLWAGLAALGGLAISWLKLKT